jgi:tetratricopeptide (TPR) repeat protein
LPDWLLAAEGVSETEEAVELEDVPDWLTADTGEGDDEDLPDWLAAVEIESKTEEDDDLEDVPDWMKADSVLDDEEPVSETFIEAAEMESEEGAADETADWLGDFELAEQSSVALPDWLDESPDLIVGQTDIDHESLPDWLDGDSQEEMVREDLLMGNSEEQENKEPDIPEDLDEAMKWLEELAAEQGADLAELPSLQQDKPTGEASAVEGDEAPDWLKADLSDGELSSEDDLPNWLKQEAESMTDDDWLSLSGEDDLSDLDKMTFDYEDAGSEEPVQSDDIPDWLKAQMPDDLQPQVSESDSDDDLGWLDQIAAGEGAPIEELPTLSWDDDQEDLGLDFEGGDLSWIADLADDGVVSQGEEADLSDIFSESAEEVSTSVPDDPDEAMAWLEQLAAQQGAPLDELPTMIDDDQSVSEEVSLADVLDLSDVDEDAPTVFELPEEAEVEAVADFDVPDDPDEAMAWLEQLAAQQGASLDELPTVVDTDFELDTAVVSEMDSSEIPTVIDLPEDDLFETETEAAGFDIPDDPDEAMAWLEQLAARQGASLDELPTVDVMPEMKTPVTGIAMEEEELEIEFEPEAVSESEVDPELEMALAELSDIDMPEDDDEALAWLAAFTVGETAEEEEEPEPIHEALEDISDQTFIEPEAFQAFESFEPVESIEIEAVEEQPLDFGDVPQEDSLFDTIEDETDQFIDQEVDLSADAGKDFEDEDLDPALPDWLQIGPLGDTSREELDWLDSFGDSNVDSWLEAEEEITQFDMPTISEIPEPEPIVIPEPQALFETGPLEEQELYEDIEVEAVPSGPVDEAQLESARSALEIGDFDAALDQYNSLLRSGQGIPLVIADLETASMRHTNIAPLQRLLGDAYMQNGQLQKAIDTYRQALDNL